MSLISNEVARSNALGVFAECLNENEYLIFDYWFYEGMSIKEAAHMIEYGYEKTRRIFQSMLKKMEQFCDENCISHELLIPEGISIKADIFHSPQSIQLINAA